MTKLQTVISHLETLPISDQERVADAIIALSKPTTENEFVFSPEELVELERRIANPGKLYSLDEVFGLL